MKKIFNILLILFTMCVLCSCNATMFLLAGIKQPHFETKESLKNYAEENKIDSLTLLTGKDSLSMNNILSVAGNHANIIVFSKEGHMANYVEKESCPGPVENYLRGICSATPVNIDSSASLNTFYNSLTPLYESVGKPDLKNNDLTIFIFWSVWNNKRNRIPFGWRDTLSKEAGDCNYKVFMVDMDLRAEHYGLSKRTKIKSSVKAEKK